MQPPLYSIKDFAAKVKAKYPEYNDIDDTTLVQKITDKYPEYKRQVDLSQLDKGVGNVQPTPPKQAGMMQAANIPGQKQFGNYETYNTGADNSVDQPQNIDHNDPVKAVLEPLRNKYAEAQKSYDPFRNRSVADATVNRVLPVELSNKTAGEVNNKQIAEKNAIANLALTEGALRNQFDDVEASRKVLDKIKANNGGVVPKDNMTGEFAQDKINSYNKWADKLKNSSIVFDAIDEERKLNPAFDQQYQILKKNGDDIPKALEGQIVSNYTNRHAKDLQAFVKENPDFKDDYEDLTNNFTNRYPEAASTNVQRKMLQAIEDDRGGLNLAHVGTSGFNDNVDKLASKVLTPDEQKIYNEQLKGDKSWVKTNDLLNSAARKFGEGFEATKNSVGDLLGDEKVSNDIYSGLRDEATNTLPQSKGIRDLENIAGGFLGTVGYMALETATLKKLGVPSAIADKAPVFNTFYHDMYRQGEMKFGDKSKAAASAIANTAMYMVFSDIFPSGKVNAAIEKLKPQVENAIKEAGANESIATLKGRIADGVKSGVMQLGKGAGEMNLYNEINKGLDHAFGLKGQAFDQAHPDDEAYNTTKQMLAGGLLPALIHGAGRFVETKPKEEATTEAQPNELHDAINELPDNDYAKALKKAVSEKDDAKINSYLKEIAEQVSNPQSKTITRKMFGDKLSDIAVKLFPDAKSEPIDIGKSDNTETPPVNAINETNATNETVGSEDVGGTKDEEPQEFSNFKNHVLDTVLNVKDNSLEHTFSLNMDYKTREQAVKNIREGKDTKAARQMLDEIKQMYDDGFVYLNRGRGNHTERIQIPIKDYMAEVNKPFVPETDLDELNTMLGEDSFKETFDNAYNEVTNEKARTGEIGETPTTTEGTAAEVNQKTASSEGPRNISGEPPTEETVKPQDNAIPEQSANAVDVRQSPTNGEEMGGGNAEPQEPTQEGAPPTEPPQGSDAAGLQDQPKEVTGVKKAITDKQRAERGLPPVELPKMTKDNVALQDAKERVDSGKSNPREIINRILEEKTGHQSEDEVMDIQYYSHQLAAEETNLRKQLAAAENDVDKAEVSGKLQQLSDDIDRLTEADRIAGNQWARIGNRMQVVIDAGFNPSREKLFIKDAYGGEVPKDAQERIDKAIKERDEAIAAKDKLEEEYKQKLANAKISEMKNKRNKSDYKGRREDLLNELKKEKESHEQFLKDKGIQKMGGGFTLTPKMIEIIGKLAKTYVDEGLEKLAEIVNKIHDEIKDLMPDIEKSHVRDAIALFEAERLGKGATRREEKTQNAKPEDLIRKTTPRFDFTKNTEWVKQNQRKANAEHKLRLEKRKAFESQKNLYQKALMWAGRGIRLSILSGVNVLYKLASAATIGAALKRIPEQAIGRVYALAFKGIFQKAPIEGYHAGVDAELKWYKEFFNPKKFAKNSIEILKTGESELSKQFGGSNYEHIPLLYLPTDLHQIIKDPVKRATFEASFANNLKWAEKNGLDINDELVIQSLQQAAYKRATYEIFQESNWLSKKFTSWKAKMETKGNAGASAKLVADFLIPVSTVPTNIVRRVATTSPLGLIRGGAKVVDAYRKGIENLRPEEADAVAKQLKQGSLGTALWLVGWFGAGYFGGLYTKFAPNKKRDDKELKSDEMMVGGKMVPKPVQHALPLEIIQFASTARRVYDNYRDNKVESKFGATEAAGLASIGALAEQIPIVSTGALALESTQDPYYKKKFEEDINRRFEPQILRETGVVGHKNDKLKNLQEKYADSENVFKNDLKAYDRQGKPREISQDEFANYKKTRDERIKEDIAKLYQNGIKGKPFDKLTDKEVRTEIEHIKQHNTEEVKKQMFGKEKKTYVQKKNISDILKERKKLYK